MENHLEPMGAFFDARLDTYDEHMLTAIEGAKEFYPFTASLLPKETDASILDLGCGTGLELACYFPLNPTAKVTGIDLAPGMLGALKEKFGGYDLTTVLGSYFDVPFGESCFDAAVSVESLHHFTQAEKLPLYTKLARALKPGGCFILTDYFAPSEELEQLYRSEYLRKKALQGITDDGFYHYDTPLTVEHETEVLRAAGFASVEVLNRWEATCTLRAVTAENSSKDIELYIPSPTDMWFVRQMQEDPATMAYNAGWDVCYDGYHPDTGCIDFPEAEWAEKVGRWVGRELDRFYALVREKESGAFIGEVNYHYTPSDDCCEIGVVLYAPFRGRGYGLPALELLLHRAFVVNGIERLHNSFEEGRDPGLAIHRKAGFRQAAVSEAIRFGKKIPLLELELTREEYLERHPEYL